MKRSHRDDERITHSSQGLCGRGACISTHAVPHPRLSGVPLSLCMTAPPPPKPNLWLLSRAHAERTAANVPVSELGAQYVKDTRNLTDTIETYISIVSELLSTPVLVRAHDPCRVSLCRVNGA